MDCYECRLMCPCQCNCSELLDKEYLSTGKTCPIHFFPQILRWLIRGENMIFSECPKNRNQCIRLLSKCWDCRSPIQSCRSTSYPGECRGEGFGTELQMEIKKKEKRTLRLDHPCTFSVSKNISINTASMIYVSACLPNVFIKE